MNEEELFSAIRKRILDPTLRISMDTIASPPIYRTATEAALENAEAELGFRLPALLRQLYSEISNGGFGPGAGLVGVEGGYPDGDGRALAALCAVFGSYGLHKGILPLFDLGCGAWSCIDALTPDERITILDDAGLTPTRFTLFTWLEAWVTDVDLWSEIFESEEGIIMNPFTRKPVAVKRRGRVKKA